MTAFYVIVALVALVLVILWLRGSSDPAKERTLPPPAQKSLPPEATEKAEVQSPAAVAPLVDAAATAVVEEVADVTHDRPPPATAERHRAKDIEGLRRGLTRARSSDGFFGRLRSLFTKGGSIDPEIAARIEEILLQSDVGVATTAAILNRIREGLTRKELEDSEAVWDALRAEARRILARCDGRDIFEKREGPTVVLLVGVNGAGKTTSIGKLAARLKGEGRQVVLAAADTFRAAAVQQLVVWGDRIGVEVVRGKDGGDPGAVVFDAIERARAIGADVVLADTAGRLHTKTNLMSELGRVVRTTGKALPGAPHEILLVIDATNGQNAVSQAKEFLDALPISGIILTKLDGTARGGVVLGICDTMNLPVRFVGLGETAHDLKDFTAEEFVEALLGNEQ